MSTVAGWDFHVYCDVCGFGDQFGGKTLSDAMSQARANGWTIGRADAPIGSTAGGKSARCRKHKGVRVARAPGGTTHGQ